MRAKIVSDSMDRVEIHGTNGMFGSSLTGKRDKDEDYIQCTAIKNVQIGILCDGMGGGRNGEIASKEVGSAFTKGIESILEKRSEEWKSEKYRHVVYAKLIRMCHSRVNSIVGAPGLSGTTLTALVVTYDGEAPAYVDLIHIGDSRCYSVRDNCAELLSSDHSVTGDMVKAGYIEMHEISETPGNNSLTRSIGDINGSLADISTLEFHSTHSYLLCCDGVWAPLHKKNGLWIPKGEHDNQIFVDLLVNEALNRGSSDNCSALLIRINP
ncbi:MAG: serine/threonine protein phosphatase PrpC [Candidatus Thalassarchaeaceae archaeon]|jgi:serine/threonine protein phosphatase PrpC|tara:strand:- start:9250 stop:10053 length:804 start_codon:yes stop_codon:yes gene_type:complete